MTSSLAPAERAPELGVELLGRDLSRPMGPTALAELRAALLRHRVVVLPDQSLTVDQHRDLAAQLGPLLPASPVRGGLDERHPEVRVIDSRRWDGVLGVWHADLTYLPEPSACSVIYARVVPPGGTNLEWSSTEDAHDRLEPGTRERLTGLQAEHYASDLDAYVAAFGPGRWEGREVTRVPPVRHPVVRAHPDTGRRGLFVNPWATQRIIGVDDDESQSLLQAAYEALTDPAHVVSVDLRPGTVVLTDTRNTLQRMAEVPTGQVRIVHRLNVRGTAPEGPVPSRLDQDPGARD